MMKKNIFIIGLVVLVVGSIIYGAIITLNGVPSKKK